MKGRYLRTALGIMGIAGIIAFLLFPNEKSVECFGKNQELYPYGDSASGAAFAEVAAAGFRCELLRENGNCGAGISFSKGKSRNFRNWNLMDSLMLDIQSSAGIEELIVQILAFDPDHTDSEIRSTMKPMIKELKLVPGERHYSIYMEHFYTPDYWFEQQGAKESGNFKRFSAVSGVEIFSGWANKAGAPLELNIENVCVEGHSNAPFVVLVCYLGILIAIAISVRVKHISSADASLQSG